MTPPDEAERLTEEQIASLAVSVQNERNLEAALLAIIIEAHPRPLTELELVREVSSSSEPEGRAADVRKALEELVGLGLMSRRDRAFTATQVALRIGELELGL